MDYRCQTFKSAPETVLHKTGFLDLPFELREQIYSYYLDEKVDKLHYFDTITLVSRQVRKDIMPMLLKEAPYFIRMKNLCNWVVEGPPELVTGVCRIFLRVVLDSRTDWSYACMNRFNPFLTVPNLRSLRLKMDSPHDARDPPIPYKNEKQKHFLLIMAKSCPKLESLEIPYQPMYMDFIAHLKNLRHLQWTGYSLSTPGETLKALKALPSLSSLTIRCTYGQIDLFAKQLSFTDYVLANMRPLERLEIFHQVVRLAKPMLVTHDMMLALATHQDTLRDLTISYDYLLDQRIFEEILSVISSFELTEVRLKILMLTGSFFPRVERYLAPTIKHCDISLYRTGTNTNWARILQVSYAR